MAYDFTAANSQYLSINEAPVIDIVGELTLAAWVQSDAATGASTLGKGIISKFVSTSNQRSYALTVNNSNVATFIISRTGTSGSVVQVVSLTALGSGWNHLCARFIPSVAQQIYLNGTLNISGASPSAGLFNSTSNLWIGVIDTISSANAFDGRIADVGIWNIALTASEILALGKGATCNKIRPQNLQFYAPLIRNLQDIKSGLAITANNTPLVSTHPRIYK